MVSAATPFSYYQATSLPSPITQCLEGNLAADVAIVGGGYTGLGAARELARQGVRVVLCEAETLGFGASGRNGGQAQIGQRQDQVWLEKMLGKDDAHKLWDLALDAQFDLEKLISEEKIACEYSKGHLHLDHKPHTVPHSQHIVEHLNRHYHYHDIRFVSKEEARALVASDGYYGGTLDARGGHLHPLNLALGLASSVQRAGAEIYTHTRITALARRGSDWLLSTAQGTVRAAQVILAGDGMLQRLNKVVDAHVMPINNFIAVTAPLGAKRAAELIKNNNAVSDSRFVVYYYRLTPDHRLLFGGGESYSYRFPTDIGAFVRPHMLRIFPQLKDVPIDYAWGGTLGITVNRMPMVREIEPGLFTAAGYSGLGVILAPYFGKILAQAIIGNRTQFDVLARIPIRRFPGGNVLRWPTLVAAMSAFALRDRL